MRLAARRSYDDKIYKNSCHTIQSMNENAKYKAQVSAGRQVAAATRDNDDDHRHHPAIMLH